MATAEILRWALLLCLPGVLVLHRSEASQLPGADSSRSDEDAEPGEGWPLAREPFRADVVCRARCLAKCLANTTAASGNTGTCDVTCSSFNVTWLHDICTTASCRETCGNSMHVSGPVPAKAVLHDPAILHKRLALSWDSEGQDVVIVVRHNNGSSDRWQYNLTTQSNGTFYMDLRRVCAKTFQIAAVNQFGPGQASDVKNLSFYRAVKDGTFSLSAVEPLPVNFYSKKLKVSLRWQNTSGDVPAIRFSLRALEVLQCAQARRHSTSSDSGEPRDLSVENLEVNELLDLVLRRCTVVYQLRGRFGVCYDTEPVNTTHRYDCKNIPSLKSSCILTPTPSVNGSSVSVTRHGNVMTVSWDAVESTEDQTVQGYTVQVGEYGTGSINLLPLKNGTNPIYNVVGEGSHTLNLTGFEPGVHYGVQVLADLGGNDTTFDTVSIKDFVMVLEATSPRYTIALSTSVPSGVVASRPFAAAAGGTVAAAAFLFLVVALLLRRGCRRQRSRAAKRSLRRDEESMAANVYSITPAGDRHLGQGSPEPPTPDRWEVAYDRLDMGQVLGKGQFGIVVKANVSGKLLVTCTSGSSFFRDSIKRQSVEVAVKMLHDCADSIQRQEFRSEMKLMKDIGHHSNLVSLLGCCTSDDGPLCLIVEHCCHGDLLHFLRANRGIMMQTDKEARPEVVDADLLTANDLLSFASQIARGMEYLSQKGYIHRDLAARNVMVADNKTVKIGDFGLTRYVFDDNIYVHRRGGKLPIKWMSIEALYDQVFTSFNDVWSFGVLLFELVTLGASPYPGIHNRDIPVLLKRGDRMQRPENCSDVLYAIMIACWHVCPEDRPTFTHLRIKLEALLEEDTPYLEFNQDYSYFPFQDMSEDPDSDGGEPADETALRADDIPMVCVGESDEDRSASIPSSDDVFAEPESGSLALLPPASSSAAAAEGPGGGGRLLPSGRALPRRDAGCKAGQGRLQKRDSGLGSEYIYSSRHADTEDVPLM